jgi:hypothetical protein
LLDEPIQDWKHKRHIHITNDEEIKEGGYVFWEGKIYKYRDFMKMRTPVYTDYFSIILTTDTDLIKDGVQAIDDEFLEWFVKNPSCEFVNIRPFKKFEGENEVEPIYKIIIPKEEPKQTDWKESTKALMEAYGDNPKDFPYEEPKQEQNKNKYSEEEVLTMLLDCRSENPIDVNKWFEQFKKK